MSRIRANNIVNGAGTGAPTFPNGAVINGITTITADVSTTGSNLTIGTGTTISNPSNNEFRILTNGGERVRVDSSGNVGIGTTNPQRLLHIYTGDNAQLVLESPDTLNDINLTDTGGSARIRNSGGELRFFTGGDPSSLNVANGSNNVAITTDGNMEIANGNLVFSTAGTGIDFSATADGSGTTTSEVLDDYEEGTWTPVNGNGTGTFDPATWGRYTRIGHRLWLSGYVKIDTMDNTSSFFEVDGIPFAAVDTGAGGFVGTIMAQRFTFATSTATQITIYQTSAASGLRLYGMQNNTSWDNVQNVDLNADDAFYFSISYEVA